MNLKQYLKAFHLSQSIESLIPMDRFINNHVLLTNAGSAVTLLAPEPIDDECLEDADKDHIVRRVIAANMLLDRRFRYYQYVFRTRNYDIPCEPCANPAAQHIKDLRINHLRKTAKGGTIAIYHAIEKVLPLSLKVLAYLNPEERERHMEKMVRDLEVMTRQYSISLADILHPRTVDQHEALTVFQRLLWPGSSWNDGPDLNPDYSISRQLRTANVYWDARREVLRVGRRFVRVFTLKDTPDESMPNLFRDLLAIDADLTIVSVWHSQDRLTERERLVQQRNLVINCERYNFGSKRAIKKDPTLAEDLRNAGAKDDLVELNEMMRQLRKRASTGLYSVTVLLHGDTQEELEEPAGEIDKVFRLPSAVLHEETGQFLLGTVLPSFFGTLPGNDAMNVRQLRIRNDHYAELSSIWGSDTGSTRSSVLGTEYANVYETRMGPLFYQDTHYGKVGAQLILGRTRGGKTVYQEDTIAALQAQNPITRIYDVWNSYATLAGYFGGQVIRCSLDDWDTKINPLHGNERSASFREFAFQFVRVLEESDGYKLRREDHIQLDEKLKGLFRLPAKHRRLGVLRNNLDGPLKDGLTKWVEGGQYGMLFDHAEDNLAEADFLVYEFERASQEGVASPYIEPLMALLIYRDTKFMLNRANASRLKHVTLDECPEHWKHPYIAAFNQRMLKTWQKKLVMLSMIIQSPEDMGLLEPFILQNCTSFCFFPNPKIKDDVLVKMFGFDPAKIDVFRNLKPGERLFHAVRDDGEDLWKVLKLSCDAERYWLYTTSPKEIPIRDKAIQKHGSVPEALKALAASGC